jgi:hypothetical protein
MFARLPNRFIFSHVAVEWLSARWVFTRTRRAEGQSEATRARHVGHGAGAKACWVFRVRLGTVAGVALDRESNCLED